MATLAHLTIDTAENTASNTAENTASNTAYTLVSLHTTAQVISFPLTTLVVIPYPAQS